MHTELSKNSVHTVTPDRVSFLLFSAAISFHFSLCLRRNFRRNLKLAPTTCQLDASFPFLHVPRVFYNLYCMIL